MPFPALSLPLAAAIGIPIGLAGFALQETVLRRRAARRESVPGGEAGARKSEEPGVTAVDAPAPAAARPAAVGPRSQRAVTPAPARPRPARTSIAPKPGVTADTSTPPAVVTRAPAAAVTRAAPSASATKPPAAVTRAPAATRAKPVTAAPRPPSARKPAVAPARKDPLAARRKRLAALNRGLEAIIAFADGPARRAGATVCADALLLAVPKTERGEAVDAFLHAAGAKEAPARLQELAEDAGVELALAMKVLNAELRKAGA